ncbi:MAG: hypothetical protein LBI47_00080, partial [Puniceicoccales bacterium]|nr:hypothetical protein [Puniceicoccales bacterium]
MIIIAKSRGSCYHKNKMDLETETLQQTVEQAQSSGEVQTATITVNGRQCTITARPIESQSFQRINIKIEAETLDGQTCTVRFTYGERRDVDQGLQSLRAKIEAADHAFMVYQFSSKIAEYAQPTLIGSMSSHAPRICTFLKDTENFVRQNDLTEEETLILKQGLRKLCSTPVIGYFSMLRLILRKLYSVSIIAGMFEYFSILKLILRKLCSVSIIARMFEDFPINECDHNPHCRTIALQAESLEMLLDAKACGQVGLVRNVPPAVKVLGSGEFNTVKLAHTKPGVDGGEVSGPRVLKPCDPSKSEKDPDEFVKGVKTVRAYIGPAPGSYRRNKATSKVQDMLLAIGQTNSRDVPRVIATVSTAEMDGAPCIAMEMLAGKTVGYNVAHGRIGNNNEFVRRETWMQVQDVLTGQIDRHGDNVMLTGDGPIAIDHDLSFPTDPPRKFADKISRVLVYKHQTPQGHPVDAAIDGKSPRNYCMPPVIDRDMYNVIMAIDLPALENMYKEHGLTKPEIGAAMARAKELQRVAQKRMTDGLVIEPNQWESSLLVTQQCNA